MAGGFQQTHLLQFAIFLDRHHQPYGAKGIAVQGPGREIAGAHGFHFAAEAVDVLGFVVGLGGYRGKATNPRALGVGLFLGIQAGLQAGDFPAQVLQVFLFGHLERFRVGFFLLVRVDLPVAGAGGGNDQQLGLAIAALPGGLFLELHVVEFVVGEVHLLGGGQFLFFRQITGAQLVALGNKVRLVRRVIAAMLGQGHFQGMRGGALFLRGKADPEDEYAVEGQRQKHRKGETI